MKYLFIILLILSLFSCKHEEEIEIETEYPCTACGMKDIQKNLPWLKKLIEKAKTDKTGNYEGWVWLEKYKGQDIFVTNMMLGSGGIMYWFFDCSGAHLDNGSHPLNCSGKHFTIEDAEDFTFFIQNMKYNVTVYSIFPFDYFIIPN